MIYKSHSEPLRLIQSDEFQAWVLGLRDPVAQLRIQLRLERLIAGNPGDVKPVGLGISEMRIHHGPGYRVYFQSRGGAVLLLCGGHKRTQAIDIRRAIRMAQHWIETE